MSETSATLPAVAAIAIAGAAVWSGVGSADPFAPTVLICTRKYCPGASEAFGRSVLLQDVPALAAYWSE